MKKLFYFVVMVSSLASCTESNEICDLIDPSNEVITLATKRTVDNAIEIALKARSDFGLAKSRQSDAIYSVVPISTISSRAEVSDTSLYVVNFENDGFAIISSNPRSVGLLAITEDGRIENIDEIENPGLKQFVYAASRYIPEDSITGYEWYDVETVDTIDFAQVQPRISTRWGQRWPEGYLCPNGIAGCVPLALAQTLAYFEEPKSISYTYSSRDIDNEYLNWSNVKNVVRSINLPVQNFNPLYYSPEYMTLARVCREIGQRLSADYISDATGSRAEKIPPILSNLAPNLNTSVIYYSNPNPEKDLGNGIIIVEGYKYRSSGHTWLIDGWKRWTVHHKGYTMRTNGIISVKELEWDYNRDVLYSHYNWGWNGMGNGYYYYSVFNPSKYTELDEGVSPVNGDDYSSSVYFFVINK